MQTQKDHTDTYQTKIIQEEPVHPMLQGNQEIPERHFGEQILESDINPKTNVHHYTQNHTIIHPNEQPFHSRTNNIVKKNYETHVTHVKTNQEKFKRENEKIKKHYEDYIHQLESENQRLIALEKDLEALKDQRRILEADIVRLKTELEVLKQTPTAQYEVEELQKQVHKLERENIDLMDIIKIKKNEIIELEENIDVNNTEVELERKKLHERIDYLKHQISIKKPEVVVKEIVKERYIDLPPLEPKVVTKYVAPPVVYQECNCGCACHEESVPQNKFQSTSYYTQYKTNNNVNHHQHSHEHQHHVQSQQPLFDQQYQQQQEHQVSSHLPLFQKKEHQVTSINQNNLQHHQHDHNQHHQHEHNLHHQHHQNYEHQHHQHEHELQHSNNQYIRKERLSNYGEHFGSPRISQKKVTGVYETIQKGNDIQTNYYENEHQYRSAHKHDALI